MVPWFWATLTLTDLIPLDLGGISKTTGFRLVSTTESVLSWAWFSLPCFPIRNLKPVYLLICDLSLRFTMCSFLLKLETKCTFLPTHPLIRKLKIWGRKRKTSVEKFSPCFSSIDISKLWVSQLKYRLNCLNFMSRSWQINWSLKIILDK